MTVESVHVTRRGFIRSLGLALPALAAAPSVGVVRASAMLPPTPDLSFLASHVALRRRHQWTNREPNPDRLRMATDAGYSQITVHHVGMNVIRATTERAVVNHLDGVLGAHLGRRFGDVGYHFLIDYAGRVWEGRSLAYWGAHVSGHNDRNLGIVLLGNFERQRPSQAQLSAMGKLVGRLQNRYQMRRSEVYGHIDLGQTLCPGKYLYPAVRQLKLAS